MVALITGGRKASSEENRQAVLDTWADNHTYWATHEPIASKNVLWLPDVAETGGYRMLGRKVIYMWAHIQEQYLDQYEWFMKADDDTYVNRRRLEQDLKLLDSDLPFFLGLKRYGSDTRDLPPPSEIFQQINYLRFCHGGAGYIVSRGLLRMMGDRILECNTSPPSTYLEDVRFAACVYRLTGVDCMDLRWLAFGALDGFDNRHNQTKQSLAIPKFPNLALRGSFHSVHSHVTRELFNAMLMPRATVDRLFVNAERVAAQHLQAKDFYWTPAWACRVGHENPMRAICTSPGITIPERLQAVRHSYKADDRLEKLLAASQSGPSLLTALQMGPAAGLKRRLDKGGRRGLQCAFRASLNTFHESGRRTGRRPMTFRARVDLPAETGDPREGRLVETRDVVLVSMLADPGAFAALHVLVKSLRDTAPSDVDIVVFLPDAGSSCTGNSPVENLHTDPADPGVSFWSVNCDMLLFEGESLDLVTRATYAAWMAFLRLHGGAYDHVVTAPVHAVFQQDPFKAIDVRGGTSFFLQQPLRWTNQNMCKLPLVHQMMRITPVMHNVFAGRPGPLARSLQRLLTVKSLFPGSKTRVLCRRDVLINEVVWHKQLAGVGNTTIFDAVDGPVADLRHWADVGGDLWRLGNASSPKTPCNANQFVVVDGAGRMPAIVVYDKVQFDESSSTVMLPPLPPPTTPTPDADDSLPDNQSRPLTDNEWPASGKAHKRFAALFRASSTAPEDCFREAEALMQDNAELVGKPDPNKPKIVRVASPKTHKTGSSTLSSVLYRFCVRHRLRMFHKGDWSFLGGGTISNALKDPSVAGAYHMEFHHLSPNGKWKGQYATAHKFYKHILSERLQVVTIFREPRQQYVSWAYFYHVPNHRPRPPLEVLTEFVEAGKNSNPLAGDFGLYTDAQTTAFIDRYLNQESPDVITLVLLSERFDEGLLLLRRILNWDLRDITYLRLLDSSLKTGIKRWDGKILDPTPKIATLPEDLVAKIGKLTELDARLYQVASQRFQELVDDAGPAFAEELEVFRAIQTALATACSAHPAYRACVWYGLSDLNFFRTISAEGYSPGVEGDLRPPEF